MAPAYISLLFLSLALVCTSAKPNATGLEGRSIFGAAPQTRHVRLLDNLLTLLSGYDYDYDDRICLINGCPPWKCQDDSAVIHGFCCGCARPTGIFNLFGGNRITRGPHKKFYCPSRGCPHWSCQDDSSVIHGYCCGCAHPDDNVPFVTCRPDLRCPLSSEPLCTDYNFMLDCCCTGP